MLPLGPQREAQGVLAFRHGQRVPVDILAPGDLAVRGGVGLKGRGLIERIATSAVTEDVSNVGGGTSSS